MQEIICIYGVWFFLLYIIPFILFFKMTEITARMKTLEGLCVEAVFNDERNFVSMNTNFDIFANCTPVLRKNNYFVKLLETMCSDSHRGERVSANAYIVQFKEKIDKFVSLIFTGVHIPLIIVLFMGKNLHSIFIIHIVGLLFVFALKRFAGNKLSIFTNILYKTWYDRISNLDLVLINKFKPNMITALQKEEFNQKLLHSGITSLTDSNKEIFEILQNTTLDMTKKLDEFINMQREGKIVTLDDVTASFDENLEKINELNILLSVICDKINDTLPKFTELSDKTKIDINAMNKNAALVLELKEQLSAYKSRELSEEINHLERITTSFEDAVISTFKSIETTITQNANDLRSSYDTFFGVCSNFNEAVSKNFEMGTKASLDSLNNNFTKGLLNTEQANKELENAVKLTSESTQKLCDAVYNFTQFTSSPHFMDKIKGYLNFTRKLNDANSKLISYEKLLETYQDNIEFQDEDKE
ncbi:MAG: hypothetical protein Ta2B_18410 [Termitinemataceae bacterium]|nr:MAG: hypothetical protein Ta2B_18410 [Termitinemataceae bacterium]